MTDEFDLGPLFQALEKARRPWREANRTAVADKVSLATLSMLEAAHVSPGDQKTKVRNMGMYVLGLSNLVTLCLSGAVLQALDKGRQFEALKLAMSLAWLRVGGAYVWEDATIMRPEELAQKLDKLVPTVPKGVWSLKARFHIE